MRGFEGAEAAVRIADRSNASKKSGQGEGFEPSDPTWQVLIYHVRVIWP